MSWTRSQFSIKKASKLVKEIGRQVAIDRCIKALLFLIVLGIIAIIIVKWFVKNSTLRAREHVETHIGVGPFPPISVRSGLSKSTLHVRGHVESYIACVT